MKFQCLNPECKKIFHPHPFIGMKHPSKAKCPACGTKGALTEEGQRERGNRFHEINQTHAEAKPVPPKER